MTRRYRNVEDVRVDVVSPGQIEPDLEVAGGDLTNQLSHLNAPVTDSAAEVDHRREFVAGHRSRDRRGEIIDVEIVAHGLAPAEQCRGLPGSGAVH